ncbi:DUF4126 domain-containing protein [Dokdonia sp. Hel_I_53]|uniref:DUF4126 domain-containing protein n=1 Tax=Dokdonia sp. Hel_I_53 TaxID=1566287 RepID=UPI0011996408|nr:DUF4126 domain-containing protein [Dokdonia sp. Hel_I_53]TVZ51324.1 uncharacterized protein DUF4126 [Dokdonia sp. Hel_I_53]
MNAELVISIILGFSLAASAGFRVFVPLLVLSVSSYFGWFVVNDSWQWLGSTAALVLLSVATIVEVGAYLIPWVDNTLDTISVPIAAIAGTLLMVATMSTLDPVITWSLAIIAGGGAAAAISGSTSVTRLGSTATTGGLVNPVISTTETLAATTISTVSIFSPIIALLLLFATFWFLFKLINKIRKK